MFVYSQRLIQKCRFDTDLCLNKSKEQQFGECLISGCCRPLYFLENQANYIKGRAATVDLAGKDALVAATSPVHGYCHCCFLFLKIQPGTKPWLPCFPW